MNIKLTGIAIACTLSILNPSLADAETRIRVGGTGTPEGPDTKVIELFKEKLESDANNGISVQNFPSSQLGTYGEMVEQVKAGALECLYESVGVLGSFSPVSNIEGVAYLYHDEDHFFRIWRGSAGTAVLDSIARDAGFRVLGPGFRGFRQFIVKSPVESLSDLQNMKVRAPGIPAYITSIAALGVSPASIAFEETYAAVQQGVVDGLENSLIGIKDHRFFEVAKHLVITNHMAETMGFLCNEDWYAKQDDATKAALNDAANAAADWYRDYTRQSSEAIIDELKASGVTVHTPDLKEFIERAEQAKHDPELQSIVTQFHAVE